MHDMVITGDPTGHFTSTIKNKCEAITKCLDACGFLPYFFDSAKDQSDLEGVKEVVSQVYGFPLRPMDGGSVNEEGVYSYPEDPDLYPVCKFELLHSGVKIYVYQYGICHFLAQKDGETFTTRID